MYRHLQEHLEAFGPAEIRSLVCAFNKAWESIQASGAKFQTGAHAESARAILANHIIEAAKEGELDQARLRDGALVAWAQSNLRKVPSPARRRVEDELNRLRP
jgi:hypothetical protein